MSAEQKKYDVFISYSHADKSIAEAIFAFLTDKKIRCFIDSRDLQKGKNWSRLLPSAIRNSRLMLAIFSHNFNISEHTDNEISIASNRNIPILVFRITDDDFDGTKEYYLTKSNWIEAFPEPDKYFGELYKNICLLLGIKGDGPTIPLEPATPVAAFTPEAALVKKGLDEMAKLDGDRDLAAYYFRKAAKAGYPEGEYLIAMAYYTGNGIPRSLDDALHWLHKAADHGESRALYWLGRIYRYGIGVERNPMRALELYTKSAELGNGKAMKDLGRIFKTGELGVQDSERAQEYYAQALDTIYDKAFGENDPEAMVDLSYFFFDGEYRERNYDYAVRLNQRALPYAYPAAYNNLGICYDSAMGLKRDLVKSHEMQMIAANLGLPVAMNNVSQNFLMGHGVEQNIEEFKEWRRRSAECGCERAMNAIGYDYYSGEHSEVDLRKAQMWLEKAIKAGSLDAMNSLAQIFESGAIECDNCKEKAFNLYKQAAMNGNVLAYYYLGNCYKLGIGTPENDVEAERWYLKIVALYEDMLSRETEVFTSHPGSGGLTYCSLSEYKQLFALVFYNLAEIYSTSSSVEHDLTRSRDYRAIATKLNPELAAAQETHTDSIEQLEEALSEGDSAALDKLITIYQNNRAQLERIATYAVEHKIFPLKRDYVTGFDHVEEVFRCAKVEKHQTFVDYLSALLDFARESGCLNNSYTIYNAVCREVKRGNMNLSEANLEFLRDDANKLIDDIFAPGYLRRRKEHFDLLFPGYDPERIARGDIYDERHFKLFYTAHTNFKNDSVASDMLLEELFAPMICEPLRSAIVSSECGEVVCSGELHKVWATFLTTYDTLCDKHADIQRVKLPRLQFGALVPVASVEQLHTRGIEALRALISLGKLFGERWNDILSNSDNNDRLLDIAEAMEGEAELQTLIISYVDIQTHFDTLFSYVSSLQNAHLDGNNAALADELNAYVARLEAHGIPHDLPHYTPDNLPEGSTYENVDMSGERISDDIATDVASQTSLGDDYYYGQNGKTKDYVKAAKWYRMAANSGDAYAQYSLGYCYEKGQGIPKLPSEAVKWYRAAAEQQYTAAQIQLGLCFEYGRGIEADCAEAVRWYTKAAERGSARGQCNLGYCYKVGKGCTQDYTKAHYWLKRAANQDHTRATSILGDLYYYGQGVEKDYNEAVRLYRKAADKEYAYAQYDLGWCYEKGLGVEKNATEAVKWYTKASKQGNIAATSALGRCLLKGDGIEKNITEALKLLHEAADRGSTKAQNLLGECYEKGEGVEMDISEALKRYKSAADGGNSDGANNYQRLSQQTTTESV